MAPGPGAQGRRRDPWFSVAGVHVRAPSRRMIAASASCLSVALVVGDAGAFTVNITARNPRTIYLQVGVGTFTGGTYNAGGSPANNPTVNVVSVTVPAAQVGSGAAQAMTTNSTASQSLYDNYTFCNLPGQLYIGGFYRSTSNTRRGDAERDVARQPGQQHAATRSRSPRSAGPAAAMATPARSPFRRERSSAACRPSARSAATNGPRVATRFRTATAPSWRPAPTPVASPTR